MIMEELQSSKTEESNTLSTEESHVDESSNNQITMDYTDIFTTNTLFNTRDDLISWAREVARQHMMVLVVKRSDNGGGFKKGRIFLGCERGGEYRNFKGKHMWKPQVDVDDEEGGNETIQKPKKRKTETKKCGCRFLLRGRQTDVMGPWTLLVDWAVHNHPIENNLQGHSFVGRLLSAEEEFVLDSSTRDIQLKKILHSPQKKDSMSISTMKTMCNDLHSPQKKDSMSISTMKTMCNDLHSPQKKDSMSISTMKTMCNDLHSPQKKDSMSISTMKTICSDLHSPQKKDSMSISTTKTICSDLHSPQKKDSMNISTMKTICSDLHSPQKKDSMNISTTKTICSDLHSPQKKDSNSISTMKTICSDLHSPQKDSMSISTTKTICSELHSPQKKDSMSISTMKTICSDLHSPQKKDSMNISTMKTICHDHARDGVVERAGQSQLQYLIGELKKHDYYFLDRRCKDTNEVKDLFFAHPTSVNLLRAFPNILLMDCTYKKNKYGKSLLEIVGVTSTNMTFSIACVYMEAEKEDNYIWACSTLRALMNEVRLPYLIVTDRELALMNAVYVTFPTSSHFLCRWHINKNIKYNCKSDLKTKEKWEVFNSYWKLLMFAEDETTFNERYTMLVDHFQGYPDPVKYLIQQWIEPYKEKFVACWTNQILHYGNTSTNRAESHHAALKKQLGNSLGNFETCWDQIHTLYAASHNAIKCSFEKSINVVQHKFKSVIFKSLRGMVSIHALQLILDEVERCGRSEAGVDLRVCGCNLRKTCGLPCAHELTEYIREDKPIPLSVVDDFWKKLNMEESKVSGVDLELEFRELMRKLDQKFRNANESGKLLLLKRLQEVLKEWKK
ncbi:hypothetical protein ACS0TY_018443 [Phlomoides rotata]